MNSLLYSTFMIGIVVIIITLSGCTENRVDDITIKVNVTEKHLIVDSNSRLTSTAYFITDGENGMVYETNVELYNRMLQNYTYTVNVTKNGFINDILIGA